MRAEGHAPGAAALQLVPGVRLLRPDEQVFTAMVEGWASQQLARNLAPGTIAKREQAVRAFAAHADAEPWQWTAQMVDEWLGDLRGVRGLARSTIRNYSTSVSGFCQYLTDPAYGWAGECEARFGTHPVQVVHAWNTAVHVQDNEGRPAKRAFTVDELQAFFDLADDQAVRITGSGRKGWLPLLRDATLFKVAYAFGLRRNEARMLDAGDFGANPHAAEFGSFGLCRVRHGKAKRGSPPKRRSVLNVWPWLPGVLAQWTEEARPLMRHAGGSKALWPSERGGRIGLSGLDRRFAAYRAELGLDDGIDFHSLRRSYVTHLVEDGWDPLFVQQQAGHEYASTTALYTCVSSDFRTRTLRAALDAAASAAMRPGKD
jgi:site-specific recombinase XerD